MDSVSNSASRTGLPPVRPVKQLGRSDLLTLAIFPALVFFVLIASGNLTTGPRTVDDNQIYKLQIEFEESGFVDTLQNDVVSRIGMGRLVPVHCLHKVLQARLFGGNLLLWSVWVGLVGSAGGCLLYLALRLLGFAPGEGLIFSLIVMIGDQSILWWRLLHGEGIGMVLFASGLVCMAQRIRTDKRIFEFGFILCIVLAMLAKESFILTVPALLFLKIWFSMRLRGMSLNTAIGASWSSIIWLTLFSASSVVLIRFGLNTTHFSYTGWDGYNHEQLVNIIGQHARISHLFLPIFALIGVYFVACTLAGKQTETEPSSTGESRAGLPHLSRDLSRRLFVVGLFWGTITIPQLLLYMKSGMLNGDGQAHYARYIVPAIVGYAFVVAELLRMIRIANPTKTALIVIGYVLVGISLGERVAKAYRHAEDFAEESRYNDQWFAAITEHIEPDDPVVLVYPNRMHSGYQTQVAMQVYYILTQRHGQREVYFLPIPDKPSIEQARLAATQSDTRHHAKRMRHVDQIPTGTPIGSVALMNCGFDSDDKRSTGYKLEEALRSDHAGTWFKPEEYQHVVTELGYRAFYKKLR